MVKSDIDIDKNGGPLCVHVHAVCVDLSSFIGLLSN